MEEGESSTSKSTETSLRKLRILASSLTSITKMCKEPFRELDIIGGKIAEKKLQMEEYMKQISESVEENNSLRQLREKEIEELCSQREIVHEQYKVIEEWEKVLETKEKSWDELRNIIGEDRDEKERQLNEKFEEAKLMGKNFEESCKELKKDLESVSICIKFSEIQLEEKRVKEAELNMKQRHKSLRQVGLKENSLDGKFLQIFLNGNEDKHKTSMPYVSAFAIQQSADPAMFVLESVQWFYSPHFRGEKTLVVKSSCIIILEQFMKLSPAIGPEADKEAKKVAYEWVNKMRNTFHDVLGFLLLLGAYKLVSHFGDGVLRPFLRTVASYPQFHQLQVVLGIEE